MKLNVKKRPLVCVSTITHTLCERTGRVEMPLFLIPLRSVSTEELWIRASFSLDFDINNK